MGGVGLGSRLMSTLHDSLDTTGTEWMARGLCRAFDRDVFFPRDGHGVSVALKICRGCPVRTQCLAYALDQHIEYGIWGATSERERRRLAHL